MLVKILNSIELCEHYNLKYKSKNGVVSRYNNTDENILGLNYTNVDSFSGNWKY